MSCSPKSTNIIRQISEVRWDLKQFGISRILVSRNSCIIMGFFFLCTYWTIFIISIPPSWCMLCRELRAYDNLITIFSYIDFWIENFFINSTEYSIVLQILCLPTVLNFEPQRHYLLATVSYYYKGLYRCFASSVFPVMHESCVVENKPYGSSMFFFFMHGRLWCIDSHSSLWGRVHGVAVGSFTIN